MATNQVFSYSNRVGTLVKISVLSTVGASLCLWLALSAGDRGLVIQRFIRLTPEQAHTFYWVMFVVNLFAAVVFTVALLRRRSSTRRLELFDSYLLAPSSRWILSNYEQVIPYKSISSAQPLSLGSEHILRIHHRDGTFDVERTLMASNDDFDRFAAALVERLAQRRSLSHHRGA